VFQFDNDNTESQFFFCGRIDPFSTYDVFGEGLDTIEKMDDLLSGRVVSYGLPQGGDNSNNKDWIKIRLNKSVV